MKIKGKGILRHYFHGTYSAGIVLGFASVHEAEQALGQLGSGWKQAEKDPRGLVWYGNSEALSACEEVLEKFGADKSKIASIAKSIDYGEPFEVTLDVVAPEQEALF